MFLWWGNPLTEGNSWQTQGADSICCFDPFKDEIAENLSVVTDAHMLEEMEKEHLIIAALDQQQTKSVRIYLDILHPRTS